MSDNRPSKKQKELQIFIDNFTQQQGYGPSYREIMRALDYKSVSTVAVHVDGLIARGLLRKTDHSARSLEIVSNSSQPSAENEHITWLKKQIKQHEVVDSPKSNEQVKILCQALAILLDQKDD